MNSSIIRDLLALVRSQCLPVSWGFNHLVDCLPCIHEILHSISTNINWTHLAQAYNQYMGGGMEGRGQVGRERRSEEGRGESHSFIKPGNLINRETQIPTQPQNLWLTVESCLQAKLVQWCHKARRSNQS